MKIVTVLRTGAIYKEEHAVALYDQCKKYAPNIDFLCVSDSPDVPGYVPMLHDWPHWWGKMEAFLIKGPVLYLDLDTIVRGSLDNLVTKIKGIPFVCLRDFYHTTKMERTVASGVMAWSGDMSFIYKEFAKDPEKNMAENKTPRWWGDQGFIERHVKGQKYFQDLAPREIISWKVHCKHSVPKDSSIIAFHGTPKPWDLRPGDTER